MAAAPNMVSFLAASDPVAALRLQQQQAIAQQLMETEQPNPNQTAAGGQTVRINPLENLADAGKQLAGAYIQKSSTDKLAQALQNSGDQSGSGSSGMAGGIDPSAPLTGNRGKDYMIRQMVGDTAYAEQVKAKLGNAYVGPNKLAEGQNTITNGTYTDAQGRVHENAPMLNGAPYNPGQQQAPASQPPAGGVQVSNIPAPPSQVMPNGQPDNIPPAAGAQSIAPASVATQVFANPGPKPGDADYNPKLDGPIAGSIAGAKEGAAAQATKTGTDAADVGKTLTVMQSNLPIALQRFQEMRGAAKDASYGVGTESEDGSPPIKVVANDQMAGLGMNNKTSLANAKITQTSAQGVLPELGPALAQAGIKGNKFLETLSSNASAIPLHLSPEAKAQNIDGLESQFINNLKATSAQARKYGDPTAPTDEQIDAQVAAIKQKNGISSSGAPTIIKYYASGKRM